VVFGAGVLGALTGGIAADAGQKSARRGGILIGAIVAAVAAVPATLFPLAGSVPLFAGLLFAMLLGGTITGLITATALAVLLPNELRGLSVGVFLAVGGLVAFGIAPSLVTALSTLIGGEAMLGQALALVGFAVSVLGNLIITTVTETGSEFLGVKPTAMGLQLLVSFTAAFSLWFMFLLIYRYLPYRRVHWRTALVAASFTTFAFEVLRRVFAWYALNIANYSGTYANFINLVILVFWMYWIGIAFIIGGEVGQVYSMRRIRRRQKERLI
jgi:hypothetical protein